MNFLEKIQPNILDKNNKISASKLLWFFRKNPIERQELFELTPNCHGEENFMERIFWLMNGLDNHLICANPSCENKLIGVTRWSVSKEEIEWNKDNHRLTCCRKCRGELHSHRKVEVHEKRVKTYLKNHGVESAAHLDTNRFKTNNPMKDSEVIEKKKKYYLEKYGVDNPSKSKQVMNKIIKRGYRARDYVFPSGKTVRVRGYEGKALDELLKTYDETDLEVSAKRIPKIKYYWEDGSEHYYFPDIYIEKENRLIEVKSTYFMRKDFVKNIRKKVATEDAGYDFSFMIYAK